MRTKKTSKFSITWLCERIHRWPVNSSHERPDSAENVSIRWRHYVLWTKISHKLLGPHSIYTREQSRTTHLFIVCVVKYAVLIFRDCPLILCFIQYFARNWTWYSLRGLHIRITWFSLYGIRIPLFSLYGIHMPLLPYMVIQPIAVLGMTLLWAAMDSSVSQGPLLWRHNMTVIVSRDTRGRERDSRQRLDNANARRLHP